MADDDLTFPIVLSVSGYVPQTPAALQAQLLADVAADSPGYTANLPGILIEDISSTDVYAMLQLDSSIAEIIDSATPYGVNAFLLNQLGSIYGVQLGAQTNTSVYVQFSGPPGFVIVKGFTVSDGTYQYLLADGGVIGAGGVSVSLYAVATITGSWAVPANTVNQIITSVPSAISPPLSVTNPTAGLPAVSSETQESYRARVLQAGYTPSQGTQSYLKTLLQNIPGVQARLVSVLQTSNGWEIICGGGDPYQIGYAIYESGINILDIVGSTLAVSTITNANPGVVTTLLNHGLTTGNVVNIAGVVGMTGVNNTPLTVTVISETTFSIGINTTSSGAYVSGGVITPNPRNISVSLLDFPDSYELTYVDPPQQIVAISVLWNTISTNYVNPSAVSQSAVPALIAYVMSIYAGQPLNQFVLVSTFQAAIVNIIPAQLLTRLIFSVSINGVPVSPEAGTGIIAGDPESYFYTDSTQVTVTQG